MISKRQLFATAGAATAAALTSYRLSAQHAKLVRVGLLVHRTPDEVFGILRQGFTELGYVEGRDITFEARGAQGQLGRLPDLATELIRLELDAIMAVGGVGARALQKATTKIPIIFAIVLDPVASGFAAMMERPGGNVTDFTNFDTQQAAKQFELLKEIFPKLSKVAIVSDQEAPRGSDGWNPLEKSNDTAARALGLEVQWLRLRGVNEDVDAAVSAMMKTSPDVMLVLEVPATTLHQKKLVELATMQRLPTMLPPTFVDAGGLIAYGTTILDAVPRVPSYVDKILKGANPGDLPIGVVTYRKLFFNAKTAEAVGVTIPAELLKRADRIIQ